MSIFKDLIIFEMANSHQGSIEHGVNIIKEMGRIARKYNIKAAVKFQYRDIDTFIHPEYKMRKDVNHIPRFMETKLNFEQFCELVEAVREEGLISISTPFDEQGIEWCIEQGLDVIKIASCSAMDWPLLEEAARSGKPLIISTGGKTLSDIDKIYNFFTHRNCEFALLHCVAEYPAPFERLQLDFIDRMKKRYRDISIGYSGHEDPNDNIVSMLAVAKGATIFERHVGLPTETVRLNAYSMNPEQTEHWVKSIIDAKNMCSLKKEDSKFISQEEIDSLKSLMRGIYAKRTIKKGENVSKEDVFFAMPIQDGQMNSGDFYDGLVATKDYDLNAPIIEKKYTSDIKSARSVIHDAKGMLFEAGIALGKHFEVELSHHYGMKNFRQTGAVIVNLVNREYCKKLVIVLPGQKHPSHMHELKEETFQLLYGDLAITIDGSQKELKQGDMQTVLRNQWHSFSSKNGAIFEEISTTHIKGDSYYADMEIAKKDLMERKTIIKEW
ncbi:N-acetylneuraminate synthase family protein [Lysinibacillus fusiformis]|uniref:N-acetylneuraminate synthase family protein n=1 Tax=Lysinibacillus fusiformis TaxID=28031 RepID=UPI001F4D49B6|nr:N-acetylneuraminate synthase family protein [Lysinibacillus fusiformis]MCK1986501.1 N-acetylneuraminate synthase family protein [Lysinibacillus fusiformis]